MVIIIVWVCAIYDGAVVGGNAGLGWERESDVTDYTVWWGYASGQEDHALPAGISSMTINDNIWAMGATVYFVAKCTNSVGQWTE